MNGQTSLQCPDGHPSTANDFCSECGLQMAPPATGIVQAAAAIEGGCPVCKTQRDDVNSRFCGVCGYNFDTGEGGDVIHEPPAPPPARPAPRAPVTALNPRAAADAPHIEIEITFDEGHADAPKGEPPRKFSLYDEESLIGRRSASTPQTLGLEGDDYLSRRHLLIIRQGPRSYVARLFDGTNGGTHNGKEMTAGVEVPLAIGDRLAIGTFTVLRVLDVG